MNIKSKLHSMSYLMRSRPLPQELPIVIQFPVNDICNSRCQMCRIWENKKSADIEPERLREGLRNPLFRKVQTVGINGGEPTLRKDLGKLTEVLFEELPSLRGVSLISNSYKYQEVIARITEVGEVAKRHGGRQTFMVSLDGYGEVHDRVRGRPGNFKRAQNVIDFAIASPLVDNLRFGCTVIRENVYHLDDLLDYAKEKGVHIKYRLGIPHQRLYTKDLREPYALTEAETYHFAEFLEGMIRNYETDPGQNFFYRSLIDQMVHDVPRQAGCNWQHRGATITSKGELLYCAVESKVLGDITKNDSEAIYFGNADHLREIQENKCDSCNHDYTGIPPRQVYQRQQLERLLARKPLARLIQRGYHDTGISTLRQRRKFDARLQKMRRMIPRAPSGFPTSTAGAVQDKANTGRIIAGARPRVMICGWYGTETLGDKAILGGIQVALEAAWGPVDLTIVSLHPYVTRMTRAQMPELEGSEIVKPEQAIACAGDMDLVAFGGGPLMALPQLAEMEAIFEAAARAGVQRMVAGCGVGPLGDPYYNASIMRLLRAATHRIYRDERSRNLASEMGIDTSTDTVAEDPAFTWLAEVRGALPPAPEARLSDRLVNPPIPFRPRGASMETDEADAEDGTPDAAAIPAPGSGRTLLLGLRDFPWQSYARHLSQAESMTARDRYETAVVGALEFLVAAHPDLTIRPLPMCTNHFGNDDRWFYRRLFEGNNFLQQRIDVSLLGSELAPVDYVAAFQAADVALTMRFHSLVFALGLEVPTVAIDYTLGRGKVQALADRFGVAAPNLATLTREALVEGIETALATPRRPAKGFEPIFARAVAATVGPRPARKARKILAS
ncbi:polysaccharide pyruvyl transferase family protein [Roseivivax sp. THAF30]|uniref:polysaccharide pyruvyl transferase family protein n=1 Tax=Roseivivax sp. THAF30 TaxID=2587852 RepID=UPI0012AA4A1B|nr:polysaccharide pyruvyl transferase family protein [Roseivivax sp. THAF30]QFT62750.1 molybdenum cofactor biosynthesis protein A [Roseivivax sp. THAF30]